MLKDQIIDALCAGLKQTAEAKRCLIRADEEFLKVAKLVDTLPENSAPVEPDTTGG